MFKTKFSSVKELKRNWYLIDAKDANLGKISVEISKLLIGKHKTDYSSNLVFSDHVVVINSKFLKISDKKINTKMYYTHSGYPGGLKEKSLSEKIEKNPEFVITNAVGGMLPKNKLRDLRLKYLHVYPEGKHEYEDKQFINIK